MVKNILAAVVGYVAFFVAAFVLFSVAFVILGVDRIYLPGVYNVSMLWIVVILVLSFLAAVFGGYVCKMIAKNDMAVKILAGIMLVLGLILAISQMMAAPEDVLRSADIPMMEAMFLAIQPDWVEFVVTLLHVAGVFVGAGLKKTGGLT